jgi:hypothetical protein
MPQKKNGLVALGARRSQVGHRRRRGLLSKLGPRFNKCLGLGIAPREPILFQSVGPPAPALTPLNRPFRHHPSVGEGVKYRNGRIHFDGQTAKLGIRGRRGDGCWRVFADFLVIPKFDREPSLDCPNMRPISASSPGPKLAHGKPLTDPTLPLFDVIHPVASRASSLILLFAR